MKKIDIPIIPLQNECMFPHTVFHLDIHSKKAIVGIEKAMLEKQLVFLATQKDVKKTGDGLLINLYEIGTIALIRQMIKLPKGVVRVVAEGICRGGLGEFLSEEEYLRGKITVLEKGLEQHKLFSEEAEAESEPDEVLGLKEEMQEYLHNNLENGIEDVINEAECIKSSQNVREEYQFEAYRRQLLDQYKELSELIQDRNRVPLHSYDEVKELPVLLDNIASAFPFKLRQKVELLGLVDVKQRYEYLAALFSIEIEVEKIRSDIHAETKQQIDKSQRDYYMREQIKVLKEKLGDDSLSEAQQFRESAEKLVAGEEIKSKLNKEISRFEKLSSSSAESAVERTYIETLLEMPWDKTGKEMLPFEKAEKILEDDHYGLDKVKERILEYIAVSHLKENCGSTILCLAGPPGTGKTSIAKSMARAMNKKYVRICLGGVHDEAEIRGHRKTYIGAMPGRVALAIKQAGVKDPLILLDEIDKMSRDFRGDTASAMLEVLDSEQNRQFRDHYLELPLDLSKAVFVATANDLSLIDEPLRDRMEVIELSGYTVNEKFHIAKEHLIKKQRAEHGIQKSQLTITDKALMQIIQCYTKEAGVRELERMIAKICRKVAKKLVNKKLKTAKVSARNLKEYLGKEKYAKEKMNKKDDVGIVRGLAWTSVGGVTLEIEVNEMPGKGELKLTGQLGDVMKESAMTALSYVRSVSSQYGVSADYFETHDLHIHIPEGAVPKDGPSAGITLATAMLSAVTGRKVRADVAMTGEITLRGRVLPIGGLKEKMLAGKLAGAKTILIPTENQKDLDEIDDEIKSGLNICAVESMKEVLDSVLAK